MESKIEQGSLWKGKGEGRGGNNEMGIVKWGWRWQWNVQKEERDEYIILRMFEILCET